MVRLYSLNACERQDVDIGCILGSRWGIQLYIDFGRHVQRVKEMCVLFYIFLQHLDTLVYVAIMARECLSELQTHKKTDALLKVMRQFRRAIWSARCVNFVAKTAKIWQYDWRYRFLDEEMSGISSGSYRSGDWAGPFQELIEHSWKSRFPFMGINLGWVATTWIFWHDMNRDTIYNI
jgi:hypothetical protein